MDRRDIIKKLLFSTATAKTMIGEANTQKLVLPVGVMSSDEKYVSKWHSFPNMIWTGEDLWAQRLQDWCIKNGKLTCLCQGVDRTAFVLTHQLKNHSESFYATATLCFLHTTEFAKRNENFAGFRIGVKGRFEDYRSAIMTGVGIDIGVTRNGFLFIGKLMSGVKINEETLISEIRLVLSATPLPSGKNFVKLKALDKSGNTITAISEEQEPELWVGNIALVSHFKFTDQADEPSVAFSNLSMEGKKMIVNKEQVYGPIYFAQYTVQPRLLKLTAQFAPIDIPESEAELWIKKENKWVKVAVAKIHPLARIATFRVNEWQSKKKHFYSVRFKLPLRNKEIQQYTYDGTIASEPNEKSKVKALAFSCNWDFGFPDNEVVIHASKHNADMAFFLGDQFYESNGGFGIQMNPIEKAELDYLRKWYQFGWSYRNLFRNIPMVALPDDHDMYHGNIWGAGGRATIADGDAATRQDSGGYKMPAEWVNMAQLTQTSHMPDAFDPTPVAQNIGVYYTHWEYGGISFAIIEDRKFKSPPKEMLPEDAKVWNGFAANPMYDHSKEKKDIIQLLGDRQLTFLQAWKGTWKKDTKFKVLVSATPFCCLQTLPEGSKTDQQTPDLQIPEKGEYLTGDAMTQDMDSNGWPHSRRDELLLLLSKSFDLHIAGDQHLPSVVKYGVQAYGDSAFAFAVPALCNIWPRRWFPKLADNHQPLPGKPQQTGNFEDGFGNKITVHAIANPHKTGRLPAILYDRVPGYGVVEFDKTESTITLHCWPRQVNPAEQTAAEFAGWPITFKKNQSPV